MTRERNEFVGKRDRHELVNKTVKISALTAIVLILQLCGIVLKLPFLQTSVSLVLIPIALGAMLYGPGAGAWLGFVFGAEVLIVGGIMGTDFFTMTLFQNEPLLTSLTCILKSTLAGFLGGVVFKLLKKLNTYLAVFVTAALVPIVNTGVFILCGLMMSDTLSANFVAEGSTVIYFLVIGCAGINFVFEFFVNLIFAPVIHRIIAAVSKKIS